MRNHSDFASLQISGLSPFLVLQVACCMPSWRDGTSLLAQSRTRSLMRHRTWGGEGRGGEGREGWRGRWALSVHMILI